MVKALRMWRIYTCSGAAPLNTQQDFSHNHFITVPRLIIAISTKHFQSKCLKEGAFQALNKMKCFLETWWSDWRQWEAGARRGCTGQVAWLCWAEVASGPVDWFCQLLCGHGRAVMAPQPPQLPWQGLEPSLQWPSRARGFKGENEPSPPPVLWDAGTVVSDIFWLSRLYSFLPAVVQERECGECSLPLPSLPALCRPESPWMEWARVLIDGVGQGHLCMGEAGVPVADAGWAPCGWGRPWSPWTGQDRMQSIRWEGQAEKHSSLVLLCQFWEYEKEEVQLSSQINFPDKSESLHHPGREGRVTSTALRKECAVLSAWALKGIVSHCFPVNAGRAGHGAAEKEGARSEVMLSPSWPLSQTWLWLFTHRLLPAKQAQVPHQPSSSQQPVSRA